VKLYSSKLFPKDIQEIEPFLHTLKRTGRDEYPSGAINKIRVMPSLCCVGSGRDFHGYFFIG